MASETPGERLGQGGVPRAELDNAILQRLQAGAVVRSEHFPLDDRKVHFDLIEPAGVFRCMDDDDPRMTRAELLGGTFTAM